MLQCFTAAPLQCFTSTSSFFFPRHHTRHRCPHVTATLSSSSRRHHTVTLPPRHRCHLPRHHTVTFPPQVTTAIPSPLPHHPPHQHLLPNRHIVTRLNHLTTSPHKLFITLPSPHHTTLTTTSEWLNLSIFFISKTYTTSPTCSLFFFFSRENRHTT